MSRYNYEERRAMVNAFIEHWQAYQRGTCNLEMYDPYRNLFLNRNRKQSAPKVSARFLGNSGRRLAITLPSKDDSINAHWAAWQASWKQCRKRIFDAQSRASNLKGNEQ